MAKTLNRATLKQTCLGVLCAIVLIAGFYILQPFKITDPLDPRFDINKFSFCDYDESQIANIFMTLFPIGSSQEMIDRALVDSGGAGKRIFNWGNMVSYSQPNNLCDPYLKQPPHHLFYFDDNQKLLNIAFQARIYLYDSDLPGDERIQRRHSRHTFEKISAP